MNRKEPRLFKATCATTVAAFAVLVEDGTLPVNLSGHNGSEHFVDGCLLVGCLLGAWSGWPRKRHKRSLLDAAIDVAVSAGVEELHKIHKPKDDVIHSGR